MILLAGIFAIALAAIGVVSAIHLATNAPDSAKACQQEYQSVQDGLFAYMAHNSLAMVPASAGTSDMTTVVPLYNRRATATDPSFVKTSRTEWSYGWDTAGRVTSISEKSDGPSIPVGCIVSAP